MKEALIDWGTHPRADDDEIIGWLKGQRGTSLFHFSLTDKKLTGAFIPDADEHRKYKDFETAAWAAEAFMREWIIRNGDLIFKIRAQAEEVPA